MNSHMTRKINFQTSSVLLSTDCKKEFKENDPELCVKLPHPHFTDDQSKSFDLKVKDKDGDDCGRLDAAFETAGVYVNGKFHADKLLKTYENSLKSADDKKLWSPVLEKSISKCEVCGEYFKVSKNSIFIVFLSFQHRTQ